MPWLCVLVGLMNSAGTYAGHFFSDRMLCLQTDLEQQLAALGEKHCASVRHAESLQSQLRNQEQTVKRLQSDIETLSGEKAEVDHQLFAASSKAKQDSEELMRTSSALSSSQAELASKQQLQQQLQQQLKEQLASTMSLRSDLTVSGSNIAQLQQELSKVQKIVDDTNQDVQNAKIENDQLKQESVQLSEKVHALTEALDSSRQSSKGLQSQLAGKQEALITAQRQLSTASSAKDKVDSKLQAAEQHLVTKTAAAESLQQQLDKQGQIVTDLEAQLHESKLTQRNTQADMDAANAAAQAEAQSSQRLQQQLNEEAANRASLQSHLQAAESVVAELQIANADQTAQLASVTEQQRHSKAAYAELQDQLAQKEAVLMAQSDACAQVIRLHVLAQVPQSSTGFRYCLTRVSAAVAALSSSSIIKCDDTQHALCPLHGFVMRVTQHATQLLAC